MMATMRYFIVSFLLTILICVVASQNSDCTCATKPVYFTDYTKLHKDFCDQKISSELSKLEAEIMECQYQSMLTSSIYTSSLATCNSQLQAEITLCQNKAQVQTAALQDCIESCPRPLRLVSFTEGNIVHLSTGTYYFSPATQKLNWYMADLFCKINGWELASVETGAENSALINHFGTGNDKYWISGTDQGSESEFYWSATGQPFGETFFEVEQPDNGGGSEDCVQFFVHPSINSATYKWNDANCKDDIERFVCELPY
ncbi:Hypothetical predicted protein [Cloeon dipterum]|uniref:C-type lectin domain-containing protein n=1 Tax=Cloeon dipterum TaxID=197152 RepID=A0A8S1DFU8_9INSE|nr:Hypothetical predicted protein [Cloeon dipterum]